MMQKAERHGHIDLRRMMQIVQRRACDQTAHDVGRFVGHGNLQAARVGRQLVTAIDRIRAHIRTQQRLRQITLET